MMMTRFHQDDAYWNDSVSFRDAHADGHPNGALDPPLHQNTSGWYSEVPFAGN